MKSLFWHFGSDRHRAASPSGLPSGVVKVALVLSKRANPFGSLATKETEHPESALFLEWRLKVWPARDRRKVPRTSPSHEISQFRLEMSPSTPANDSVTSLASAPGVPRDRNAKKQQATVPIL
jgi:hypothetical protein